MNQQWQCRDIVTADELGVVCGDEGWLELWSAALWCWVLLAGCRPWWMMRLASARFSGECSRPHSTLAEAGWDDVGNEIVCARQYIDPQHCAHCCPSTRYQPLISSAQVALTTQLIVSGIPPYGDERPLSASSDVDLFMRDAPQVYFT